MPILERVDVNQHRDGQYSVALRSGTFTSFTMTIPSNRDRALEVIDDALAKLQEARVRIAAQGEASGNELPEAG